MNISNSTDENSETYKTKCKDESLETETFLSGEVQVSKNEDNTAVEPEHESGTTDYREYNLIKRLKIDHPFRRRFTHTLWLFWAFVGLGWMVGLMGPSFPDLRLIVQQDVDTAAWLFTIFSVGYMVGSFAGGILYDKFNKLLLIVASTVTMAVFTGVLPWCKLFPLMLVVRFIAGLGAGGLDTSGNADLVSLWDDEGRPYMQALHFCFGFGGIISPLVTEPFLAKKECIPVFNYTGIDNATSDIEGNVSMATVILQPDLTDEPCVERYGQTHIHYAYLISFVVIGSSAVGFIYMYFKSVCNKKTRNMAADKSNIQRPDKLSYRLKAVFLVLLFTMMMLYCAVEDTFSGFLATFCINHLEWSKGTSSYATSVHWGAFAFGRFSGIFLIRLFKPVQLLFVFLLFLVSSFVGLLFASITFTMGLVWVFIGFVGFSMSIVFPCLFTWTEESILKVSGKISSMFLIAASSGLMLNPLFLGYLMDNVATICFVYILLVQSCLCLSVFLTLFFLVRKFVTVPPLSPVDMEVEVVC